MMQVKETLKKAYTIKDKPKAQSLKHGQTTRDSGSWKKLNTKIKEKKLNKSNT